MKLSRLLPILGLAALLFAAPACQEQASSSETSPEAVAALVALAQSHHEQADIAVAGGDLPAAEATIRDLIQTLEARPIDHREHDAQRLDAYGRLTRLLIDQNKIEEAYVTLETGARIARDAEPNIFAGYLFQIQAELYESQGRPADAIAAHKQAILIFQAILDAEAP